MTRHRNVWWRRCLPTARDVASTDCNQPVLLAVLANSRFVRTWGHSLHSLRGPYTYAGSTLAILTLDSRRDRDPDFARHLRSRSSALHGGGLARDKREPASWPMARSRRPCAMLFALFIFLLIVPAQQESHDELMWTGEGFKKVSAADVARQKALAASRPHPATAEPRVPKSVTIAAAAPKLPALTFDCPTGVLEVRGTRECA